MPKVSVIVPAYNVENYIEKCLNSLVNQTLDDIEIIVVNDGSQDKTKEKILDFCNRYPQKVKYLEKENGGLSSARNFGMPYAVGEYVAFLDSDDYVELSMYEEMYNEAKREDYDMVECDFIWEYPNKKRYDHGELPQSKKEMIVKNRVVAWNKLIKREVIEKAKIEFPEGLRYEDVEFFYKLVPFLDKVSIVNKYFIHYIQRENSIVNTQNSRTKEIFTVLNNVIKYYKEKDIYEEYKDELEYTYARILLCSSLKRMIKIGDKTERKKAITETWVNLNTNFPNWQDNKILKENRSLKNLYMKFIGLLMKYKIIKTVSKECLDENKKKPTKSVKENFLSYIMGLFIILSPILDITSFIFRTKFNTTWSPTTFLRPIIPIIAFIYLFFTQKKKKKIVLVSALYGIYAIIHLYLFNNLWRESSYGNVKNELQYIVNYTFMILTLYVMYESFKNRNTKILKKSILISTIIYICSIFLSIFTHTSSSTYLEGIGYKGWFESGNSLCTLLCLSLFIILTIKKDGKVKISAIATFILTSIYLIVFSGMRTGIFGVIIVGVIYTVSMFIEGISAKNKENSKKRLLIALAIFAIIMIIMSVFGMQVLKRRAELRENELNNIDPDTGIKRNVSGDILSLYKQIQNNQITEKYMSKEAQKSICELCEYASKTNMSNVNLRKQQLIYNLYLVKNQKNPFLILFGNGYKTQFRELVMEMEVPALICNFGIVGFALYLGPFIAIWGYEIYRVIKSKKIEQENILFLSGIALGFALSMIAGYTFFNQSSMIVMCVISLLAIDKCDK